MPPLSRLQRQARRAPPLPFRQPAYRSGFREESERPPSKHPASRLESLPRELFVCLDVFFRRPAHPFGWKLRSRRLLVPAGFFEVIPHVLLVEGRLVLAGRV